ncbi:MAG: YggS family pyridoxal phosphate-dependent enzyme [Pseudomonadota bacterium]|nr:YggS family pyridoxal phosphate-dependent enzyme [Pseudomonadota bacterium]
MDTDFLNRLKKLQVKINQAAKKADRNPNEVKILAISKGQDSDAIKTLFNLGQMRFGENYLQEALQKKHKLENLDIEWHFVGAIQSNKTREIAENFSFIHSINRIKIASKLNAQRDRKKEQLNILIQVKDDQSKKNGVTLEESYEFINSIEKFDNLKLRGLMYFPDIGKSEQDSLSDYSKVAGLLTAIKNGDTLSMGTSDDYPLAILSGATMVRIGTELFGSRKKPIK